MKAALASAALAALISFPAAAQNPPLSPKCDPQGTAPAKLEGVAFAGDGDTLYGVGWSWPVRLWGLNAAELRDGAKAETVPGMRARAHLVDVMAEAENKTICTPIEFDGHCRIVATCKTAAGTDLTLSVLKAGLAYGYYLGRHPSRVDRALVYNAAEVEARKARRGLWRMWLGEE